MSLAQKTAWKGCAGSIMAEIKRNTMNVWTTKTAATLDIPEIICRRVAVAATSISHSILFYVCNVPPVPSY